MQFIQYIGGYMKYIILVLLLIGINNQSKAMELQIMPIGFAYHFNSSPYYNDGTFKDNHTSNVGLVQVSYKNASIALIGDSQGNTSYSLTYDIKLSKTSNTALNAVLGVYLMQNPDNIYTYNKKLVPNTNIFGQSHSIIPLLGIEYEIELTDKISITNFISPYFILTGLTFKL